MIAIIDYDVGNLGSIIKAFELNSREVIVTSDPDIIKKSDAVVLPGVSSFEYAVKGLKKNNLLNTVIDEINSGKLYFGICIGLQILFEYSDESPGTEGLGILKGHVSKFETALPVPHIGWNQVNFKKNVVYFNDIPDNSYFYFVHSYYVVPEDNAIASSTTGYDINFVSSIKHNNIFAVQFHPEKSQVIGLKVIENFCKEHAL